MYASETLQNVRSLEFNSFPWLQRGLARSFLQGFVADVLLANREIIGGSGNTLVDGCGTIYRLDSGSALLMRSTYGRKKVQALHAIAEWYGFQNVRVNKPYGRAFEKGKLSEVEKCSLFVSEWQKIKELHNTSGGWNIDQLFSAP